jgi:hypothetical protein
MGTPLKKEIHNWKIVIIPLVGSAVPHCLLRLIYKADFGLFIVVYLELTEIDAI